MTLTEFRAWFENIFPDCYYNPTAYLEIAKEKLATVVESVYLPARLHDFDDIAEASINPKFMPIMFSENTESKIIPINPWIDASERLPEKGKNVLCFYRDSKIGVFYLRDNWYCSDTFYFSRDCWVPKDEITHWMPLPEAPK